MIRTLAVSAATLIAIGAADAAAAQSARPGSAGEVRVACTVAGGGDLTDCEVVSRGSQTVSVDALALKAADQSVAWVTHSDEHPTGRIHFPVRFAKADPAPTDAPPMPRLMEPMSMAPAMVPAPPSDRSIRAWNGLDCVIAAEQGSLQCDGSNRYAPPGVLGGYIQRSLAIDTVAGRLPGIPDLPATPAEVRAAWTPRSGEDDRRVLYSSDHSPPTAQGRLIWFASLSPASERSRAFAGTFELREYDCVGGRYRRLVLASVGEAGLRTWDFTEPRDWTPRDRGWGNSPPAFDEICDASGTPA